MSDISDSSLREDDNDGIIAEYENRDSDEGGNVGTDVDDNNPDQDQDAKETEPRRIDPKTSKKRVTLNPIPKLNTERLKGPKGIHTIEKYFEGFKFHGKGHEKVDLDRVMKRLEHWSHRLFPKLNFDDFLERLESLGAKRDLQTFMKKYRMDMIMADDAIIEPELNDESDKEESEPVDEFDILIAEQIEKQKQVIANSNAFDDLRTSGTESHNNTQASQMIPSGSQENSEILIQSTTTSELSDEIKERIERNRQQAIQRRLAKLETMQQEAKRKKLEEAKFENVLNTSGTDFLNQNGQPIDEQNTSQDV